MKYLKDILRISIFVLIMYLPLTWLSFKDSLNSIHESNAQETVNRMAKTRDAISDLLKQNRILEACQRLKADSEAKNIAVYYLKSTEASCKEPANLPELPAAMKDGQVQSFNLQDNIPLTFYRDTINGTEWAFAVIATKKLNAVESILEIKSIRDAFTKEILLVIYIIFAFIFCAVLILAKSIQNQYRKRGKDPLWLKIINLTFGKLQLHDMKVINSATSVLIQENESLAKDKDLLETSLEYSILNEVKSNNQKIPYTFYGTVSKVDINGFSKVISAGDPVQSHNMTLFLEEFGCELLQRYNGLFEKTVGDEIVVVFKSEDSAMMATAFSRDLMTEFAQLKFQVSNEQRSFTLKGSISSSDITFSKRPPGYGFNGAALTYTSRLLDMVKEKDRNFLSCMKTEAEKIKPLVQLPAEASKFEFKNMATTEGYLIDQFTTVQQAYEKDINLIKYFRSDSAFIYLLQKIQIETDIKKMDHAIQLLKQVQVRNCSQELMNTWIYTLKHMEDKGVSNFDYLVILAKLIMIGINLIPQHQWDEKCTQALLNINRELDGRINASIVDVLIEKMLYSVALQNEASFILKTDHSFRTRGNLLINQAFHQLDNSVFTKVNKMIESPNPLETNTGIFCACSIILHYQKINPAALETYAGYKQVIKHLRKAQSQNLSKRLQALVANTIQTVDRHFKPRELS